jgi:hypothetical protein
MGDRKIFLIAILAMPFVLNGCATYDIDKEYSTTSINLADDKAIFHSAQRDLLLTKSRESDYFFCLAPAPDTVMTQKDSDTLGIKQLSNAMSDGIGSEALGGRNSAVLLTRELMYRACEFSANYNLTSEQAKDLYLKQIQMLSSILATQSPMENSDLDGSSATDSSN